MQAGRQGCRYAGRQAGMHVGMQAVRRVCRYAGRQAGM